MIPVGIYRGEKVVVFGLGRTGLATACALAAGGAKVVVADDRQGNLDAALAEGFETADLTNSDWSLFAALVLSPGVPLTHPQPHWTVSRARAAFVPVIGDTELFFRSRQEEAPDTPVVAITGTNGKSTTTALIGHMLDSAGRAASVGGNIGTAILSLPPMDGERAYVVEMSSYQIDLTPGPNATVGILLNLSPDHLDRHGTMENYAAIKARLPAASRLAVVGVDDAWSEAVAIRLERDGHRVARVSTQRSLSNGVYATGSVLHAAGEGGERVVADLEGIASLRGAHNAENAAAAIAACLELGLGDEEIREGLKTFPGLAHRMQQIGRRGRTVFINDSKATNADAAARALSSFEDIYWIAGGRAKEGGIAPLAEYFPRIARAYLIGEAAETFAATLEGRVPYEISLTLERALEQAARDAAWSEAAQPAVLLSPACASFDQFPDFEKRGEAFTRAVEALLARGATVREAG
ncbi:MAG: UDP-N-acetylmuramoyl-L-alanine--D-glutamate ligase [Flavobacteriaceae bacterium]